jgi:hypothetical protein
MHGRILQRKGRTHAVCRQVKKLRFVRQNDIALHAVEKIEEREIPARADQVRIDEVGNVCLCGSVSGFNGTVCTDRVHPGPRKYVYQIPEHRIVIDGDVCLVYASLANR